jgi:hypothetical protein
LVARILVLAAGVLVASRRQPGRVPELADSRIRIPGWVIRSPGRAIFVILCYTAIVLAFGFAFVRIRDVQ